MSVLGLGLVVGGFVGLIVGGPAGARMGVSRNHRDYGRFVGCVVGAVTGGAAGVGMGFTVAVAKQLVLSSIGAGSAGTIAGSLIGYITSGILYDYFIKNTNK